MIIYISGRSIEVIPRITAIKFTLIIILVRLREVNGMNLYFILSIPPIATGLLKYGKTSLKSIPLKVPTSAGDILYLALSWEFINGLGQSKKRIPIEGLCILIMSELEMNGQV